MGYPLEKPADHRVKPEGGYVHVSTFRFGIAWWCYLQGKLTIRAVRVLLSLHELGIRRAAFGWTEKKRGKRPEFTPNFSTKELAEFCGLPEKRAKAALKELLSLGLVVEFSAERIAFARSIDELTLSGEERPEFWEWFATLTKRKRVPLPRRILALACESSSPSQIAFILGASLRCIYFHPRDGGFSYSGWLSAAWVSGRFGICLRAVKAAKSHLVGLGWVKAQGKVGRFGELIALNPAWVRIAATKEFEAERIIPQDHPAQGQGASVSGPNSAPLPPRPGPNSAPPRKRESSPKEIQRPRESPRPEAGNAGPGLFQKASDSKPKDPAPRFSPPVRLSGIKPEDFTDLARALELFRQAVKCRLVSDDGEHSRLRWIAAIERARTVPAKNPAGVFLFIIKHKKWDYLSEGHWDAANARLKAHLYGDGTRTITPPLFVPVGSIGSLPSSAKHSRPMPPTLSRDALIIKAARNALAKNGIRTADLLPHLRRVDPAWNRIRLEAAELELSSPRVFATPSAANS